MKNLLLSVLLLISHFVVAQPLAEVPPEQVGMSAERLQRVGEVMQRYVDNQWIPGGVALVARRGQVVLHKAWGQNNMEAREAMRTDHIFRLASMTKPVTSVALMILFEEGRFLLDDPLEKYIPEFANPQVAVFEEGSDSVYHSEPAKRKPTVRHLLTHTAGLGYSFVQKKAARLYAGQEIPDAFVIADIKLAKKMKLLASLPLLHHPGEKWNYGLNTDMAGYLVEVLSGQPLDEFMQERIFGPLGMQETYFFLPENKHDRLARVYGEFEKNKLQLNEPARGAYSYRYPAEGSKAYFSGGSGLVSTAADYFKFAQMLLNGGEFGGKRILSPTTIRLMTRNHIGELRMGPSNLKDFGLGFEIVTEEEAWKTPASVGTFGWSGYFKTVFWIDPRQELVAVLLTQVYPSISTGLFQRFENAVYQAVVE